MKDAELNRIRTSSQAELAPCSSRSEYIRQGKARHVGFEENYWIMAFCCAGGQGSEEEANPRHLRVGPIPYGGLHYNVIFIYI